MPKLTTSWLALVALILFSPLPAAAESVFVHSGGEVERIRLDELADGEVRTFGTGPQQVTASREGERITIRFPRGREGDAETIDCTLGGHTCQVFVSGDEGARLFLVGEAGETPSVLTRVGVGGDHADAEVRVLGHGSSLGWVSAPGEKRSVRVMELFDGSDVSIFECPEGDTTMRLSDDDDGPYFCPKHGLELERAEHGGIGREVHVLVDTEVDGED